MIGGVLFCILGIAVSETLQCLVLKPRFSEALAVSHGFENALKTHLLFVQEPSSHDSAVRQLRAGTVNLVSQLSVITRNCPKILTHTGCCFLLRLVVFL